MDELTSLAQEAINLDMRVLEISGVFENMARSTNDPSVNAHIYDLREIRHRSEDLQESVRIKMNELKQSVLLNSFEIVGIPDGAVENTHDLAELLTNILKQPVPEATIAGFETLDPEPGAQTQSKSPKVTAVHMTERCYRDRIMELSGSRALLLNDAEDPLFIRDHLTRMNKMILKKTKYRASSLNIFKVWVDDGRIFMRKTETSPAIQIRSDADIQRMDQF